MKSHGFHSPPGAPTHHIEVKGLGILSLYGKKAYRKKDEAQETGKKLKAQQRIKHFRVIMVQPVGYALYVKYAGKMMK